MCYYFGGRLCTKRSKIVQILKMDEIEVVVQIGAESLVLSLASADSRRRIYETEYGSGALQFFDIHAAHLPLGKHYHRLKTEKFTIFSGGGELLTAQVDEGGDLVGDIKSESLFSGSEIYMEPFVAHTFYLEPGSKVFCVSSLPFDQADMLPSAWLVK
jgi:hypothetical protein